MRKCLVLLFILTFLVITPAFSEPVIIVNSNNPVADISFKDIKNIYRLKKLNWSGGIAIKPVNLKANNELRNEFSEKFLNKSSKEMESYYLKRALSGKGQPPKTFATEDEVIRYVSEDKGAIAYVSKKDSSVKSITAK